MNGKPEVNSDDEKRKAALALNMCMVSVSQIIDYADVNVLKQEYDSILNNINLQHIIKDEALLEAFRSILDIVTFYLIQEGDRRMAEREYQHKLKNAVFDAFPSGGFFMGGGSPLGMVMGVASMAGVGYLNYRRSKARSKLEFEKNMWELQRSAIEQLHGMRRSLFETAWRLSEAYDFPDEWRLTERQIEQYNNILMDPDPHRQYDRLDAIVHVFEAFPPYWYFKSRAALETLQKYKDAGRDKLATEFKTKALEALDGYDRAYFPLMREDVIAASAALDKFSLLDPDQDREQMLQLLERAQKTAGSAFDVLQLCGLNYLALKEAGPAVKIFRNLVNEQYNTQLNGRLLSRIYCELDQNAEYEFLRDRIGDENVLPWTKRIETALQEQTGVTRERVAGKFREFMDRYFAARTQKLARAILGDLNAWEDALGSTDSWKERVAAGASFDAWGLRIETELNEAYNELTSDAEYREFLHTDLEIWEDKLEEAAKKSEEEIKKLESRVEEVQAKAELILKDTKLIGRSVGGLLGGAKSSVTSQYVSLGRKLKHEIRDCMFSLFEVSPSVLASAFGVAIADIDSESELADIQEFLDRRSPQIVVDSVTALPESSSGAANNGMIDYFEDRI